MSTTGEITASAVAVYAEALRTTADRRRAEDPYADGYRPSRAFAFQLAAELGPGPAIDELRRRAVAFDADRREQDTQADRARKRHDRRRRQASAELRDQRSRVSLGKRLDDVLAALLTVSEAPSQRIEEDPVSGRPDSAPGPMWNGDRHGEARRRARELVASLEDELESARRRPLEGVA